MGPFGLMFKAWGEEVGHCSETTVACSGLNETVTGSPTAIRSPTRVAGQRTSKRIQSMDTV